MTASKMRRIFFAGLGVVVLIAAVVLVVRPGQRSSADQPVPNPATSASAPRSKPSPSAPAAAPTGARKGKPADKVNKKAVESRKYPPGVKPTVSKDGSKALAKQAPAAVRNQLFRFLDTYYTLKDGETEQAYVARVKKLAPKGVWPNLDLSFDNVAQGETATAQVQKSEMETQLTSEDTNQLYITVPVKLTVRINDRVAFVTMDTVTTWEYSHGSKRWTMTYFYDKQTE